MTYQNLGYWIGQANDTSTGRHPPGWTNGQRWSESATEWMADRDANATNASTWQGRADQAWGPSRVWNNGISWETDRNNWYNQAQSWYTQRYNEGYAAGAASKTTSAVSATTAGTGGLSGSYSGDLASVTCPRTGLAHISCRVGSNGDDAAIHIFRNGALAIGGASANGGLNTTFAVQGNLSVNAGDVISVRATGDANSGLQAGGVLLVTVGSV